MMCSMGSSPVSRISVLTGRNRVILHPIEPSADSLQTRAALRSVNPGDQEARGRVNIDRRSFLGSGLATWATTRIAPSSAAAAAPAAGQTTGATASPGKSLSRQFAQWIVGLRYEDLPATVVDRIKG